MSVADTEMAEVFGDSDRPAKRKCLCSASSNENECTWDREKMKEELLQEMRKVLRDELIVEMRTDMREVMKEAMNEMKTEVMAEVKTVTGAVRDLGVSVQNVEAKVDRLDEKMKIVTKEVSDMKEDISEWEKRVVKMESKVIDQEARSRRNNLMFYGIEERGGREDCFDIMKKMIVEKCGLKDKIDIDRAHRIPTGERPKGSTPRPLICHFVDYSAREAVKKARKQLPKGINVADDLPREIRDARQTLKADLDKAKAEGKDAFIAYPARLIVNHVEVKVAQPGCRQPDRRGVAPRQERGAST